MQSKPYYLLLMEVKGNSYTKTKLHG
uniref:Uncharacterized protein n=1 Tax=Rhizophora mucronata TaxID=61149 RepID=A0A2P2PLH0_RHIMU